MIESNRYLTSVEHWQFGYKDQNLIFNGRIYTKYTNEKGSLLGQSSPYLTLLMTVTPSVHTAHITKVSLGVAFLSRTLYFIQGFKILRNTLCSCPLPRDGILRRVTIFFSIREVLDEMLQCTACLHHRKRL